MASTPSRRLVAAADAATASCVSTTSFGCPVVPLVATTSASPVSTGSSGRAARRSAARAGGGSLGSSGSTASPASQARCNPSTKARPAASSTTRRGMVGSVGTGRVRLPTAMGPADPPPGPPTGWRSWLAGARPRTLPAAVVPVLVGTACAVDEAAVVPWRALAAGVVALALQIGTNFANDYSDGVRGTDDPGQRVGPVRLVGWGLQPPGAVKRAALLCFGLAGVAGLALAIAVGPELLVVGTAAIAAGWFYTGGSHPYGYYGFGELFVFVFFGVVATAGSTYVHTESLTALVARGLGAGRPAGHGPARHQQPPGHPG